MMSSLQLQRLLLLAGVMSVLSAGEGGNRSSCDESPYLDVPPWFSALPADADPRQSPAAIVTSVDPGTPAATAGITVGDRLIGLDGRRVHDLREIRLLRSAMSQGHDQETWTMVRDKALIAVVIKGLEPYGISGAMLSEPDDLPDLLALLARLGIAVPDADVQALRWLPGRIRHALTTWCDAHPEIKGADAAPWLAEWLATYLHVLRGEPFQALRHTVAEPFLSDVDRFYRAVAAAHAAGQPATDLDSLAADRWFTALFYPYPAGTAPAFGSPRVNQPLATLLRHMYDDPVGSINTRKYAAWKNEWSGKGIEHYLGQVTSALLNPHDYIGWVIDDSPDLKGSGRSALLAELQNRFAADGEDADIAGCGLCAVLVLEGKCDQVPQVTAAMAKHSPYMAWRAHYMANGTAYAKNSDHDKLVLKDDREKNPLAQLAPFAEFYWTCMDNNSELARYGSSTSTDAQRGQPAIFRSRPDLVASSLGRDAWIRDEARQEIYAASPNINNMAFMMSCFHPYADGEQSMIIARMLLSMLGDDVNETIACTLAACHARAGDFANAQRLQEWACKELPPAMLHDLERYRMQLALYGKRQPYTETGNPADGWVPAAETWPNGAKKATGMTYFGARIGPWHFYSDKGVETALCNYYEGKPDAACRSFYPNGTIAVEGFLVDAGKRIGRWRTWHENGMLESVGCYNHVDDGPDQRTGEWIWIDAQGKRREAGFFLNGKREGNWLAWDEQGKLLSRTHFAHGRPEAAWAGTANPPEPPSPAPVDVVKKQPEKGDDNF